MNFLISKLDYTNNNIDALYQYLLKTDNDFEIPLSKKVDLKEYSNKLLKFGNIIAVIDEGEILSIIGYYTNDNINYIANWPILSTQKKASGKGYAKSLIREMINDCKKKKMRYIRCDSVNKIAISIYESFGFVAYKKEIVNDLEKVFLEYKL